MGRNSSIRRNSESKPKPIPLASRVSRRSSIKRTRSDKRKSLPATIKPKIAGLSINEAVKRKSESAKASSRKKIKIEPHPVNVKTRNKSKRVRASAISIPPSLGVQVWTHTGDQLWLNANSEFTDSKGNIIGKLKDARVMLTKLIYPTVPATSSSGERKAQKGTNSTATSGGSTPAASVAIESVKNGRKMQKEVKIEPILKFKRKSLRIAKRRGDSMPAESAEELNTVANSEESSQIATPVSVEVEVFHPQEDIVVKNHQYDVTVESTISQEDKVEDEGNSMIADAVPIEEVVVPHSPVPDPEELPTDDEEERARHSRFERQRKKLKQEMKDKNTLRKENNEKVLNSNGTLFKFYVQPLKRTPTASDVENWLKETTTNNDSEMDPVTIYKEATRLTGPNKMMMKLLGIKDVEEVNLRSSTPSSTSMPDCSTPTLENERNPLKSILHSSSSERRLDAGIRVEWSKKLRRVKYVNFKNPKPISLLDFKSDLKSTEPITMAEDLNMWSAKRYADKQVQSECATYMANKLLAQIQKTPNRKHNEFGYQSLNRTPSRSFPPNFQPRRVYYEAQRKPEPEKPKLVALTYGAQQRAAALENIRRMKELEEAEVAKKTP